MKKILSLILIFAIVFTLGINSFAYTSIENDKYTVNEAYKYTITKNSEEWRSLSSKEARIAACKVSEDVLNSMTTDALIETIVSYPLLVDMFAYDTLDVGIKYVSEHFKGIVILEKRSDAVTSLTKYVAEKSKNDSKQKETLYAEKVLEYLRKTNISTSEARATYSYVYTLNGSSVQVINNLTWADHDLTASEASIIQQDFCDTYTNAIVIRDENPAYNCHSYAWYSTGSTNTKWMNDPSAYMEDGSYSSHITPAAWDKIFWSNSNSIYDHSGIIYSIGGGVQNPVTVTSKWGAFGLFRHRTNDCPYGGSVSFWS